MVTMRRDVAAMSGNKIFDRPDRDDGLTNYGNLTEYDRFVQEKKRQEITRNLGSGTVSCAQDTIAQTNYFGYSSRMAEEPKTSYSMYSTRTSEEPKTVNSYDTYGDYMKAQLHRTSGAKLLTEEEFYAIRYRESRDTTRTNATVAQKKGLNKNGKIFIAVYVLVVMVVASIILTVNTGRSGNVETANAKQEGAIGSLAIDTEESETNWFDEVCDSLSNK